jgi:1-acyl-sn-glycerol-3-phosphate acyltransferase
LFWWFMKYVLIGPILRLMYRPEGEGLENVPEGAAILAPNHQSFLDDFLVPLVIRRRKVRMLAKADYFDNRWTAWFFKAAGCIPVRREGGSASAEALSAGIEALRNGELVGIFPEGTRSPDGRLYRGKTGVARMALEAQVPIIPVAVSGTFAAWPYNRKLPKTGRVVITFGKPLDFSRHHESPADRFVLRSVTDEVMYEIMLLSGQEYVDDYGSRMKAQLERAAEQRVRPQTRGTGPAERPDDVAVHEVEAGVSVHQSASHADSPTDRA